MQQQQQEHYVEHQNMNHAAMVGQHQRQLLQALQNLVVQFTKQRDESFHSYAHRVLKLDEPDPRHPLDCRVIQLQSMSATKDLVDLHSRFLQQNMMGNGDAQTLKNTDQFKRLFETLSHLKNYLESQTRATQSMDKSNNDPAPLEVALFMTSVIDFADNEPFHNLVLFLLQQASLLKYRRYKGGMYEQITVETIAADGTKGHLPTHAWKRVQELEEFVWASVPKESKYQQWKNLTLRAGNSAQCVNYLKNSRDPECPWLDPDRTVTAWRNGLYFCTERVFIPYPQLVERGVNPEVVACKYFDNDFYTQETPDEPDGWYQLPTPAFESLLEYQGLPIDARKFLYVMIGRMRFQMGEHDAWQVVPFIRGIAGTGKSLIGKIVQLMFDPNDVGTLSSNIEKTFGVASLCDKWIWLCLEVKEKFGLPKSEFQSMVSGESMSIPRKFLEARQMVWKSPGFMVGNEMPGFADVAGSITRRMLSWEFYNVVREADPGLEHRVKSELGVFMRKVNEAYLDYAEKYGKIDVWNIPAAKYFRDTQDRAKMAINPIISFIKTSGMVTINKETDACIAFPRFRELFFQWCKSSNIRGGAKLEKDHYYPVFSEYGLDCKHDTREVRGRTIAGMFIQGLEEKLDGGSTGNGHY